MDSPRHSKFTEGELRLMSELGEKLCDIVDSSAGKITFSEIGRQCSTHGGKLGTYARAGRFTRSVYNRASEWIQQFETAFPEGVANQPAVQLDARAFGLDPGLSVETTHTSDRYEAIAQFERESIY